MQKTKVHSLFGGLVALSYDKMELSSYKVHRESWGIKNKDVMIEALSKMKAKSLIYDQACL